jgi:hypothetical protein
LADEKITPPFNAIWFESSKSARTAQVDYGRWIVNTLWLMHSGAIAGLLAKWNGNGIPPQPSALKFFVAGIVLAFGTAAAAWLNFSIADVLFRKWTYAGDDWHSTDVTTCSKWLQRTMYIAIAAVAGSIICLIAGAVCILLSL